ncbi:ATP-dependent DNA helicase PIF1 [Anopheles darlingi]|uniref:ATP-dependent DNA helicase PIF1 n=1 Tax=Anopheles darlingi TaxID=43151 RepID=UPI00210059F9|nr:ATP-dependent DNA helicase PIF1 [Anopheles darlingi]
MDPNDASLTCAVTIEWTNQHGTTTRKLANKQATLRLIRNAAKDLLLNVASDKSQLAKLLLRGVSVHSKFMTEGKASIKFNEEKCTLFLSNAPPGLLVQFLKVIFVKLTNGKAGTTAPATSKAEVLKNARLQMLSGQASLHQYDEISPVTTVELNRAKKLALGGGSTTTPSPSQKRKRPSGDGSTNTGDRPRKKLYDPTSSAAVGSEAGELRLNEEQKRVLQACQSGRSIFFTGSAGTGKSFLLRKIIAALPPDGTIATASTGVAACLIGGTTLHSFAGIGSGEATLQNCYEKASRANTAQIWRKCKRLIIDEISMVEADYFEKIEAVARYIRKNDKAFGGIQLILCGDFFQLPPVGRQDRYGKQQALSQDNETGAAGGVRFCFESPVWSDCIQTSYELTVVHRQKDQEFVSILNSIRIGRVTTEISERLRKTAGQRIETEGILATQLCSHTAEVDAINQAKLDGLTTEAKTFEAKDSDPYSSKQLDQMVQAPGRLTLKVGAQVMLLKNYNIAEGLVNGARGVVMDFVQGLPLVKFKRRELVVRSEKWSVKTAAGMVLTRTQLPLKLAWAFSIHKSQGLTLDCVELSLSKVFEAGQAYVALSRAQSLDSIRVLDFDLKQVWANTKVLEYYRKLRKRLAEESLMQPVAVRAKPDRTGKNLKKSLSALGLSKAAMNKPLMTIN